MPPKTNWKPNRFACIRTPWQYERLRQRSMHIRSYIRPQSSVVAMTNNTLMTTGRQAMPGILNRFLPSNFGAQRCPDCDGSLKGGDINIQEGVALCPVCGKLSRLSSLNTSSRSIAEILDKPPRGCSLTSFGHGAVATVSIRSLAGFLFPAGFALFWNGITSVFVLIAIAGLYTNLIGPLPNWFPALVCRMASPL